MKPKTKLKVIAFTVFMIFASPQKVKASEMHSVYYFSYDENLRKEFLLKDEFEFYGRFTKEEKAYVLFSNLFSNTEKYSFVPSNVKILNIFTLDNCLYLNVSRDIKSYGGGNSYEVRLRAQIVKTAVALPEIDKVTLLIEGISKHLPEGGLIFGEDRVEIF